MPKKIADRNKIRDMVVQLLVKLIKMDARVHTSEIDALYAFLENLFDQEDISWDSYLRQMLETDLDHKEIIKYLDRHLITLDKIRILLTLIVLATSDGNIDKEELQNIVGLSSDFGLNPDPFYQISNWFATGSKGTAYIPEFRFFNHAPRSIFKDYILFGSAHKHDVRLGDTKVAGDEVMLIVINGHVFVGTSASTTAAIDGKKLKPNCVYTLSDSSILEIGSIYFNHHHLLSIWRNKYQSDVIEFKKPTYEFTVHNRHNNYTIVVKQGVVYRNGRELSHNRETELLFDDIIQIKGYDPFWLNDIIEHRQEIGTETLFPEELYINDRGGYHYLTQEQTQHTILHLFSRDSILFVDPPLKKDTKVRVNDEKLTTTRSFTLNSDILTLGKTQYRINSFFDLVEIPFAVDTIRYLDIRHSHRDGVQALDGITFEAHKGELLAIMGLSGCGKSTLLKTISGQVIPRYGSILYDGRDFFSDLSYYSQFIGYVPQDDILFPELTVWENLWFRGQLRLPNVEAAQLEQKISNILIQTKLTHRRNTRVGLEKQGVLSGGERKRLNMALELLFEPSVLICDEPTSGLSSIDGEQIIEILRELTSQGKVVILTIHQPNSSVFERFNRVLLLDTGGKQVFFGTTKDIFTYFDQELEQLSLYQDTIKKKKQLLMPDFVFDVLEYPALKDNGELMYEQVDRNFAVKRRFPPDYWRDKFRRKTLYDLMQTSANTERKQESPFTQRERPKLGFKGHAWQFIKLLERNILLKFRNRSNTYITFLEAPILAVVIAFILRLAPTQDSYSYYHNVNIGIFIFTSVIVFIFLGLSNSVEEIMSERRIYLRERRLNVRTRYWLTSKLVTLALFALAQTVFYNLFASFILDMRGVTLPNLMYMFGASAIGFSLGMLISTFIHNSKALINILPLILIPQIIFGGAIIQFERMNRNLTVFKGSPVPEIVQLIPSRWLFEGLYTAQAHLNSRDSRLANLEKNRLTLKNQYSKGRLGLQDYNKKRYEINSNFSKIASRYPQEVYTNRDLCLTVNLMDGRFLTSKENVFLSSYKMLGDVKVRTFYYNLVVIILYVLVLAMATYFRLKYFYND